MRFLLCPLPISAEPARGRGGAEGRLRGENTKERGNWFRTHSG